MEIDQIFDEWSIDSKIDKIDLGNEALKIPILHNKYLRFLAIVNRELRKLESRYKKLVNLKYEYYLGNLNGTEELTALGWEPTRKIVLKADLERVVQADKDVIKLTEIIGEQKEKSAILNSILKEVMSRSFNIRAAIDMTKFNAGV